MEGQYKKIAGAIAIVIMIAAFGSAASASIGRFTPTHAIEEPVYCGACHPEQVDELAATTHLLHFANGLGGVAEENGATITQAQALAGGCMMCHNAWDNRDKFGVANYTYDTDTNVVSLETMPLKGVEMAVDNWPNDSKTYTDSDDVDHMRVDKLWGTLSRKSPNSDMAMKVYNGSNLLENPTSCGNVEKLMCHLVEEAEAISEAGLKNENKAGVRGSTNFYMHEMAYTTADYVGKQVKYCAVCHVNKLPAMEDDGTAIPATGGDMQLVYHSHSGDTNFNISWQSNDFAHKNVQCIRCHSHAGINNYGTGVSSDDFGT